MQFRRTQPLVEKVKEDGKRSHGRFDERQIQAINGKQIRDLRRSLNQSQSQFAYMINVKISTLQNWEQGRRMPDGPAKALLLVVSKNPEAVLEALHA